MEQFSIRLKNIRNSRGLTLNQLSRLTGTTQATLSRYENGHRVPDIDALKKISTVLNVSTDYLLGIEDAGIYKQVNDKGQAKLDITNIVKGLKISVKDSYELLDEVKELISEHSIAFRGTTIEYEG